MARKKRARGAWKEVTPQDPSSILIGSGEGGFISLEEIDDVIGFDVPTTGFDNVPAAKHECSKPKRKKRKCPHEDAGPKTQQRKTSAVVSTSIEQSDLLNEEEEEEDDLETLPEWEALRIHPVLMKAIASLGFRSPTPIQKACIPAAAHKGKDVIGAAETGSGKTLAFGIPILQRLLDEREKMIRKSGAESELDLEDSLRALIVTPTRELALQICDHIRAVAKFTDIKIAPIVGGISTQKQERLLRQRPAIVVGTPGRLWELMSTGETHLVELEDLSFFILDEADRMVEKGHFQELQSIIDLLPKRQKQSADTGLAETVISVAKKRRQTLVFSATLTLPADFKKKLRKASGDFKPSNQNSVALLTEKAGISKDLEIVDLTSKNIVAEKLSECAIECSEEEKDNYLYYVLKVHGCGRSIVFCTSIAALRRLAAILRLLDVPAWPLHAQLQQRQRLKTMDRFRSHTAGVLIATDVAARGLDIPGVRTVIHYQLPHSGEMYVHRSGRTARAESDGCSIALVSPSDKSKYHTLCQALSKSSGLPPFPINSAYLPSIKKRVSLALRIDKLLRHSSQMKAKKTWFERHAEELGIDLDSKNEEDDEFKSRDSSELKRLQQELQQLLKQPLESKSFSRRYVTGTGLTPFAAQQLKEYVTKPGHGRFVVIGQEEMEPLQALRKQQAQ